MKKQIKINFLLVIQGRGDSSVVSECLFAIIELNKNRITPDGNLNPEIGHAESIGGLTRVTAAVFGVCVCYPQFRRHSL